MTFTEHGCLDLLINPLTPDAFLDRYWARKPFYNKGGADRFADVFTFDDLNTSLLEDLSTLRHAPGTDVFNKPYADVKTAYTVDGQQYEVDIPPHQAIPMFRAGHTIAMYNLKSEKLRRFEAGIRRELAGLHPEKIDFSLYLSPDKSGFNTHIDDHGVFFLQISGSKRWTVSNAPAMPFPPTNLGARMLDVPRYAEQMKAMGMLPEPPSAATSTTYVLEAGDVLYLPPGTWHKAEGLGHSLHLTLRFFGTRYARILQSVLGARLLQDANWRAELPGSIGSPGELTPELRQFLQARLDETKAQVAALSVEQLFGTYARLCSPELNEAHRIIKGR